MTAVLDPWCPVDLRRGGQTLYGFALHHARLGGLSWMMSSPIVELDTMTGLARTQSGSLYGLRRRIVVQDIPGEGDEAWAAYDMLLRLHVADTTAVPPFEDLVLAIRWVSACKAARHLGVATPKRTYASLEGFTREHGLYPGQ